ncbi:MAG: GAF domain-containing protein [Rhizobiales bacterium]|nr:GAF domain-containing protein [Rhizobacter sp.]
MSQLQVQSLCGQLDRRELTQPQFVEACSRLISASIGCGRAGIWLVDEVGGASVLRCLGLYDRAKNRMTMAPNESGEWVGSYMNALRTTGHVLADDAMLHPATAGLFADKLGERGVRSLLASAFSLNGELFGAFTCTQLGETCHWTSAQLALLKRIGARVSLALAGASATSSLTLPMAL